MNGRNSPFRFHFFRKNGIWGIDLTEMNKWSEAAIAKQIKEMGLTEIEFIFQIAQIMSGTPVQESIWTPLKSSAGTSR